MFGNRRSRSLAASLPTALALLWAAAPATPAAAAPPAAPAAKTPSRYEIQLIGERFTPAPGVTAATKVQLARAAAAAASATAGGGRTAHLLVQLYDTPSADARLGLRQGGLDLGAYVPGSAWIAAVPAGKAASLASLPEVRWATVWDAARKLHPRLAAGQLASWTRDPSRPGYVMLFVLLHHDVGIEAMAEIAGRVGGVALPPVAGLHGATLWLPEERIADLAAQEEVLWLEEGPSPLSPTLDGVRATMRVNQVHAAPYGLDGSGVRLFVFDGATVRATHENFDGRVTVLDGTFVHDHPTHVAGIALGDGSPSSAGGRGRGVAPGATLLSSGYEQFLGNLLFWDNAGDIEADFALARNGHGADLGTCSIASNVAANGNDCVHEGDYGVSSSLIDGIVRGDNAAVGSPMIVTWAAGNERTGRLFPPAPPFTGRCGSNYATTAPPSCAKNPITVGGVHSDGAAMTGFSSWGPCDDGRLKPVVVAPGCESTRVTGEMFVYSSLNTSDTAYGGPGWCGTSMATPAVGGTVALLIEDWRAQGHGGAGDRPLPALVKALVVHTARDLGQEGPDFVNGYGLVEAQPLIDTLRAGSGTLGTPGPPGPDAPVNWGTGELGGGTDTFTLVVPPGTGELKATLAWDDAAAAPFSADALVNDLDLELVAPDGAVIHLPWVLSAANPHLPAATGVNTVDNQEQVLVEDPAPGLWTVRVTGSDVPAGPQTYGLVYTYEQAAFHDVGCATTAAGWETGLDGWTLTGGAARTAAPAAGHGDWSLALGGALNGTDEATLDVTIPERIARAEWSFWWHMTTTEGVQGHNFDQFFAEVRNLAGATLAVFDFRWDGWRQGAWMQQQNIDLTPWAGQTIRLAFRARNSPARPTTFWVDDSRLATCKLADLWCRDLPFDTGLEPEPAAAGLPMWLSQDIWVRKSDDAGTVHQRVKAGRTNYVRVKVRNRGTVTAHDVPVQVYAADVADGLAWPAEWTLAGEVYVPSLAPLAEATVTVPWIPANAGVFSLLARIDSAQDPLTSAETVDVEANTRANNNLCWRGVLVLPGPGKDGQ
ncbi:MAG TPA: S8 family serine peptidase [Thermoanaerobaculia bacterium]|nr:S8 family serine peptidase [Thermoanaerobaculia bacterium]